MIDENLEWRWRNIKEMNLHDPKADEKSAEVTIDSHKLNELKRLSEIGIWADASAHATLCFVLDKLNTAVVETNEPLSLSALAKLKARIEMSLNHFTYPEEYK
jgi:hypothetical protein